MQKINDFVFSLVEGKITRLVDGRFLRVISDLSHFLDVPI